MQKNHVDGKNKGDILLYALSTCVWCKKTKGIFDELGVSYDYIDVDLLNKDEKNEALNQIRKFNPSCSFPTTIINNDKCIVGYEVEEIKKALGG